jgi:hypothetical protein
MIRYSWPLVLLIAMGCTGNSSTVPVQGVVRLDGQPLSGASVQFVPESTGRDATATTDEQGRFVLSTIDPRDGALPGAYKVVITPGSPRAEAPAKAMTPDEAMAASGAAAELPQSKPTGPTVPERYTRPDQTPLKQNVPGDGDVVIEIKSTG